MSGCSSRNCCTCFLGAAAESLLAQHRSRFRCTLISRCRETVLRRSSCPHLQARLRDRLCHGLARRRQSGRNREFRTVFFGAAGVEGASVAALAVVELERSLSCHIPGSHKNRTRTQYNLVKGRIARGPGTSKGRCLLAVLDHHNSLAIPGLTQHEPGNPPVVLRSMNGMVSPWT